MPLGSRCQRRRRRRKRKKSGRRLLPLVLLDNVAVFGGAEDVPPDLEAVLVENGPAAAVEIFHAEVLEGAARGSWPVGDDFRRKGHLVEKPKASLLHKVHFRRCLRIRGKHEGERSPTAGDAFAAAETHRRCVELQKALLGVEEGVAAHRILGECCGSRPLSEGAAATVLEALPQRPNGVVQVLPEQVAAGARRKGGNWRHY